MASDLSPRNYQRQLIFVVESEIDDLFVLNYLPVDESASSKDRLAGTVVLPGRGGLSYLKKPSKLNSE